MKLTSEQKSRIVASFRQAVYYQVMRWNSELEIEAAAGMDLETEDAIKDIAAMIDNPLPDDAAVINTAWVIEALNKHNPEANL